MKFQWSAKTLGIPISVVLFQTLAAAGGEFYKVGKDIDHLEEYADSLGRVSDDVAEIKGILKRIRDEVRKGKMPGFDVGDATVLMEFSWKRLQRRVDGTDYASSGWHPVRDKWKKLMALRPYYDVADNLSLSDYDRGRERSAVMIRPFNEASFEDVETGDLRKMAREAKKDEGPFKDHRKLLKKILRDSEDVHELLFDEEDEKYVDIAAWLKENGIDELHKKGIIRRRVVDTTQVIVTDYSLQSLIDTTRATATLEALDSVRDKMDDFDRRVRKSLKPELEELEKYVDKRRKEDKEAKKKAREERRQNR